MTGTLFVVSTPIGNLSDITFRAIDTLNQVDLIAAEDTRVTAKLLNRYKINTPCTPFHEHNASAVVPGLIERLKKGADIAIVSDAGTPSISDPGEQLVDAAWNAGITVSPIPGPSALGSALSVAALPGEGARFIGFLPRSGKGRKERLNIINADPSCSVLYESPHRLHQTLSDLNTICPDRRAVVLRELTKIHEEIVRGPIGELKERFTGQVKGEITIVIEGNPETKGEHLTEEQLRKMVKQEIDSGKSAKDTAASLGAALGIKKKTIYSLAVEILSKK